MPRKRFRNKRASNAVDSPARPSRTPDQLYAWFCCVIIIAVGITAYCNSFAGVFVFDDHLHITDNADIRSFTPLMNHLGSRRPLVSLSLALNYAIDGTNETTSYHAFNLMVHLLAALTLFGIVRRTSQLVMDQKDTNTSSITIALFAALLWLAHPIQTQSVTYIIQRGESLMGLFYFLTLYCVLRGSQSRRASKWYGAAIICCSLGMASKAVMVTAPLVVLLYDRTFLTPSFREALRRRRPLYLGLFATLGILAATGVVQGVLSTSAGDKATVGFSCKDITPLQYLLTQPSVIVHYLTQCVWPSRLCLDYGWAPVTSLSAAAVPGVFLLLLLGSSVIGCAKRRWWGFLGMWFFLILAPTSSFIPIRDLAFIHRLYLPLAAVAICAAIGVTHLCELASRRLHVSRTLTYVLLLLPLLGAEIVCTWSRNRVFASESAVWTDVIAKRPLHARAWISLGKATAHENRGSTCGEEAIRCYRKALELATNDHDRYAAYVNLGATYGRLRRYAEATDALQRALAIDASDWHVSFNLAMAMDRLNERDAALQAYGKVLEANPDDIKALERSAWLLASLGRQAEAVDYWQRVVARAPNNAAYWYNMGTSLASLERFSEAADAFRRAVAITPQDANARSNLGDMLMRLGHTAEAAEQFRQAIRFSPNHIPANFNLGLALWRMGRTSEARKAFERVLEIEPNHKQAQTSLAAIREKRP